VTASIVEVAEAEFCCSWFSYTESTDDLVILLLPINHSEMNSSDFAPLIFFIKFRRIFMRYHLQSVYMLIS
jgi:hypothetical protein